MRNDQKNPIVEMTFNFALGIINFTQDLEENRKFVFARQILRSGTSIGANVREAQNAESKPDFIHKLKIAAKEADETEYFLDLCKHARDYPYNPELSLQLTSIIKVLSKIISTSKKYN